MTLANEHSYFPTLSVSLSTFSPPRPTTIRVVAPRSYSCSIARRRFFQIYPNPPCLLYLLLCKQLCIMLESRNAIRRISIIRHRMYNTCVFENQKLILMIIYYPSVVPEDGVIPILPTIPSSIEFWASYEIHTGFDKQLLDRFYSSLALMSDVRWSDANKRSVAALI